MSTAETGSDVSNVAAKSRCHGVDGRRQTDSRRRDLDGLLKSLDVVRVLIFLAYTYDNTYVYIVSLYCCASQNKLSCRRKTTGRFVSWNILLSHLRSLKVIRKFNDTLE